jgi:hypothetical protein
VNRGHSETQVIDGELRDLRHDLKDENLKGFADWAERQRRYARQEAEYELAHESRGVDVGKLVAGTPLERRAALKAVAAMFPLRAPPYFFYAYVLRGGFRDGRDGFVFCLMKAAYQQLVAINKFGLRRGRRA